MNEQDTQRLPISEITLHRGEPVSKQLPFRSDAHTNAA